MTLIRLVPVTIEERNKINPKMQDSSFKGAILRSLTGILYNNQVNYNNKEKLFIACKENFMSIQVVMYTKKNFYLLSAINRKIAMFQSAGLIEFWHSQTFIKRYHNGQISKTPAVLTMSQLSGSFFLLLGGLMFAFVVFTFETILKYAK